MARYIFQGTFRDGQGNVVKEGTVTVYDAGTTTVSTIYEAASGGTAVTSVVSDSNGFFYFYVDESDYVANSKFDIVLSKSGFTSKTYENIVVHGGLPELSSDSSDFLDGTGSFDTVKDSDLVLTDVTTNNASTSKHGFLKKLSNTATEFLDGTGSWDTIKDTDVVFSDVTTNNSSTTKHGFLPKLSNDSSEYLDGTGAWANVPGEVSTLLTGIGDLVYSSAASTLARLALGSANYKLFVKADGTIPEWANGYKIISATRDMTAASGDVAYTGVGFKPAIVICACGFGQSFSVGFSESASVNVAGYVAGTTPVMGGGTHLVWITDNYGTTWQYADVKTMDSDGFTLTWTKTASPAGTANVYFLCLR